MAHQTARRSDRRFGGGILPRGGPGPTPIPPPGGLRPPTIQPPTREPEPTGLDTLPPRPVFAPPEPIQIAAPLAPPRENPRIRELSSRVSRPSAPIEGEEALLALLRQLAQPVSVNVDAGSIGSDAEARAFRIARLREVEGQRNAEAEALAASGLTSSGATNVRNRQFGEGAAEDIAGFEASLVGRRRAELLREAQVTQAGRAVSAQARLGAIGQQRAGQESERGRQLQLLQLLLAEQANEGEMTARQAALANQQALETQRLGLQGAEATFRTGLSAREQALQELLAQQELEERRAAETERGRERRRRPGGRRGGGLSLPAPRGAPIDPRLLRGF